MTEDVHLLVSRGWLVVQGTIFGVHAAAFQGVGILDKLRASRRPGLKTASLTELGKDGVVAVAGLAVLDRPLAADHVVIDAVGLDFAFDMRILQAQEQPIVWRPLLAFRQCRGSARQLDKLPSAIAIQRLHNFRSIAAILQSTQPADPPGAPGGDHCWIVVDPVPGSDQVVGCQGDFAIDVLARHQDRLKSQSPGR